MTTITGATLFTGGGGADIGMRQAGIDLRWGLELSPAIAGVANRNLGGHVQIGDILTQDPASFEPVNVLHASPPCPSFSQAKAGAVETAQDIELARQTAHFVTTLLPRVFTLENVWLYRWSKSWRIVEDALHGAGYWVSMALVNAADYGVPQTRKRMIVRAVRDGWVPLLPSPKPWRNWLDAIADLIDDLPDTELAPWQVARLAQMPQVSSLFSEGIAKGAGGRDLPLISRVAYQPAYTVTANHNMLSMKALLVNGGNPRVGSNVPTVRDQSEPCFTITANQGKMPIRVLISSGNNSKPLTVRRDDEPAYTITASMEKTPARVVVDHQIKAISIRCLARWQTIPDWYDLPESGRLAARIIGNAVPPQLMERIYKDLVTS